MQQRSDQEKRRSIQELNCHKLNKNPRKLRTPLWDYPKNKRNELEMLPFEVPLLSGLETERGLRAMASPPTLDRGSSARWDLTLVPILVLDRNTIDLILPIHAVEASSATSARGIWLYVLLY
jgi:hypothetical protein